MNSSSDRICTLALSPHLQSPRSPPTWVLSGNWQRERKLKLQWQLYPVRPIQVQCRISQTAVPWRLSFAVPTSIHPLASPNSNHPLHHLAACIQLQCWIDLSKVSDCFNVFYDCVSILAMSTCFWKRTATEFLVRDKLLCSQLHQIERPVAIQNKIKRGGSKANTTVMMCHVRRCRSRSNKSGSRTHEIALAKFFFLRNNTRRCISSFEGALCPLKESCTSIYRFPRLWSIRAFRSSKISARVSKVSNVSLKMKYNKQRVEKYGEAFWTLGISWYITLPRDRNQVSVSKYRAWILLFYSSKVDSVQNIKELHCFLHLFAHTVLYTFSWTPLLRHAFCRQ